MASNEVFVRFIITGFEDNPSTITKLIGINPSKTWIKGDKKTEQGIIKYKANGWEFFITENNIWEVDVLLEKLLSKIKDIKENIQSLVNVQKKISIVIYSKEMMPSIILNSDFIEFINDIKAEVEHDIYSE